MMENVLTWKKFTLLGLLFLAPIILANCAAEIGEGESVATHCSGLSDPTVPTGYQFDICVAPHTIANDGTVAVTIRIWDQFGNVAGGVSVTVVGPEVSGAGVTDSSGLLLLVLEVEGTAGGLVYLTAQVENGVRTVPVQILPVVG